MENKNQTSTQAQAITAIVLSQVKAAEQNKSIVIPAGYSPENALKSAYLILQDVKDKSGVSVLESCTKNSITQSLFNMVIQGLNPAKNQCYFIPYGKNLTLSRSYLGTIAVTKRLEEVKDVKAYPIYEGDDFETKFNIEKGSLEVSKYNPQFKNINSKNLIGAFAIIIGHEGVIHTEVMTMEQIRTAWNQGSMKGNSPAHKNFSEEMAMKTVINRACKRYYGTSDDSSIMMLDEEPTGKAIIESAQYEVADEEKNAEKLAIDVTPVEYEETQEVDPETGEIIPTEVIEDELPF